MRRGRAANPPARAAAGRPEPPVRRFLGLLLALTAFLVVGVPVAAGALPAPATAVEACAPTPQTACVRGTIRTADGDPAPGIVLEVTGAGDTVLATTADDGTWSVEFAEAGTYTVTLDESTLPDGQTLRDPSGNPRTLDVALGSNAGALFPLGEPSGAPAGPTPSDPASGGGEPADGEVTEPGLDNPVPGAASGRSSVTWERVAQQATAGIVFGTMLALASIGLSLIFGTTGLSNFAHGEMVTFGGIMAYVFTQLVGLPLLAAGALAVALGGALGWVQDRGIWQPLRRRRTGLTQQLIVTIGLAITLQYVFQLFFGGGSLRIVRANPEAVTFGPVFITQHSLISLGIAVVVLGAVGWALTHTRIGRATRAVSDNPALAAASGIAVDRIVRLVWVVGGALAALGGVSMGLYLNATAWNMGATLLMLIFAAVTLGGLGTAFGAVVGSIIIGLVAELSNLVIPSDMRYAGALVILILVLLFRPQGILGRAERIG